MLIILGFFTFFLGAFLSCYFQIYYSLGKVYYYWKLLIKYAIKERNFILVLLSQISEDYKIVIQQQNWLEEISNITRKQFCSSGEELLGLFIQKEEQLNVLTQRILQDEQLMEFGVKEKKDAISALENFWAAKNLFEFHSSNYNVASEKYLFTQRKKICLWLFILLSYPNCPTKIPSFY